ncbi:MAG: DHH family phosphoesterase [Desulfomonilaceae bacterium]
MAQSQAKIAELGLILKRRDQKKILVLCHNNPDPDTIASAFGFSYLLRKKFHIKSVIGYGGRITRAENKAMVNTLRVPMVQLGYEDLRFFTTIALVDAQPMTGNNLIDFRASDQILVVVDHHPLRRASLRSPFIDVRPKYGATSTIIIEYLIAAELTPSRYVANALVYGIKTDTNSLIRSCCKSDYYAFNYLSPISSPRVLGHIEKPSLPLDYFRDLERGLANTFVHRNVATCFVGKVKTDAIIPELADWLLRIEGVTYSLCMGEYDETMLISLRSTSRLQRAGLLLRRLVGKAGSSGGHRDMAGGQIPLSKLTDQQRITLPPRLVSKFLKMLKIDNIAPKPLVRDE